ncbi:Alpha/Beta hydrolase protein [Globomyces pollinis-pini]|nr:Alpha/Beta hydrolase protein [Globomyces pollinis-pini]
MATFTYEFTERWLKRPDGHEIYTKQWIPYDTKPIAIVVFFHGLAEHINRYEHVFSVFAKNGIKVGGFDQRGFGRTCCRSGKKGVTGGLETTMMDMQALIDSMCVKDIPVYVMGHSMGGGLAIRFCHDYPDGIAGVIGCSPMIEGTYKPSSAGHEPDFLHRTFKGIISRKVLQSTVIMLPVLDHSILTRDEYRIQLYKEDPYIHPYASFKLLDDIFANGEYLLHTVSQTFTSSILIGHGTDDQLTSYSASKKFIDMIPSANKRLDTYVDARHELHNELEMDDVVYSYINWIRDQIRNTKK